MARILRPRIATFGRGTDKTPRKKRGLGGSIVQGTKIGAATGATLGTLGMLGGLGYEHAMGRGRIAGGVAKITGKVATHAGVGALGGAVPLAATGALIGAGAYGVNKFLNRKKKNEIAPPTKRQKLMNAYKRLTSK